MLGKTFHRIFLRDEKFISAPGACAFPNAQNLPRIALVFREDARFQHDEMLGEDFFGDAQFHG